MHVAIQTILAVSALAVLYVVVPAFLIVYFDNRPWRFAPCPEAGQLAQIRLNARRATVTSLFGSVAVREVRDCSFWPARRGCEQRCVAEAAG